MKIILFDQRAELASAWREAFANEGSVEVTTEDFRTLVCDAIVSPANSFGYMDGGLDLALSDHFGVDELIHDKSAAGIGHGDSVPPVPRAPGGFAGFQ